ncbi:MAG: CocE/NonD family hydrolase [Aestuariivirga sp.]|uniref:CocE/NonD family hydrolase n=1 Tax=Aestuariivirga sp. TaxID=2650926 RepID=UPI0025BBB6D1|nr:CocE/NonD family hydrolase [Aestuariivirga sp.]MCA3559552.1 CocE/NonD family hydrolase [Aestuariivirga sp.]
MTITTRTDLPYRVTVIENLWIPLSDGTKLAARVWMPGGAEETPFPALLEYLPYRKRDGTHVRDALTHAYFAGHGYVSVRVDMRGNGDSEGLMLDEYAKQEQNDAVEAIAWLAAQPWCNGKVGMFGISWGGFNALQVAARKPTALKAIVTICSTDDRYEDDVHYKGGTVLNEMLGWAATMLAYSSRPPDPLIVGERWREMWMGRLENEPFLVIPWLSHPHRDDYWKHGSVCEDYAAVEAPTLVVGGWNDAYSNAVPRLMKGLRTTRKAIIGPWAHKYPHFAVPEPRIGFLQECLRWWDQWLKGANTGVSRDPDYRYYVMEPWKPGAFPDKIEGRWIGDSFWGFGHVETKKWWLNSGGIGPTAGTETPLSICSRQTTGADGGEYCIIWLGPEFPGDQARDDAQSITFDTPALIADIDIVGQPVVELEFSADKPVAHIAVRLNDVWPSGEVSRITYHLQNLCMRDSRENPMPLEPGKHYRMKIKLDDIAMRVPKGHKLRVAISTSYFPMMWPAPEPVTLTVYAGKSQLHLPLRKDVAGESPVTWPEAEAAPPADQTEIKPAWNKRETVTDPETGELRIGIVDDFGEQELHPHGLVIGGAGRESYSIMPDDPLSAKMETHWTETRRRGGWSIRTETFGRLTATARHWIVWGRIEAYEGDALVFEKEFNEEIPRLLQ